MTEVLILKWDIFVQKVESIRHWKFSSEVKRPSPLIDWSQKVTNPFSMMSFRNLGALSSSFFVRRSVIFNTPDLSLFNDTRGSSKITSLKTTRFIKRGRTFTRKEAFLAFRKVDERSFSVIAILVNCRESPPRMVRLAFPVSKVISRFNALPTVFVMDSL